MRWKFSDLNNVDERRARAAAIETIDRWWREFSAKTSDLNELFTRKQEWDLPGWMHEHLNAISPELMWEFGPGLGRGRRLVITPESNRELRPIVQTILDRAPKIDGWTFLGFRPSESLTAAVFTVKGRMNCDISSVRFLAKAGHFNRVDLQFLWPRKSFDKDDAFHAAFIAAETLLGEEALDKRIGAIEVGVDKWFSKSQPLEELPPVVAKLFEQMRQQQFSKPCFQIEKPMWTIYKLEPKEQSDYPGQSDIFVKLSMLEEMWKAALGSPFYSESFSKCGETFCYLKIDGSEGLEKAKLKDRAEIEDAVRRALTNQKIGGVVGGGTGLRYSYVDLALTDVERGITAVRKVMQDANISRRSWILFFDIELLEEWVGIWDDTPPPPR